MQGMLHEACACRSEVARYRGTPRHALEVGVRREQRVPMMLNGTRPKLRLEPRPRLSEHAADAGIAPGSRPGYRSGRGARSVVAAVATAPPAPPLHGASLYPVPVKSGPR
jgi:hypothetical protein